MISLPAAVQTEAEQSETWPVRLFEIIGTDGSVLRYCDADVAVYQNGKVWSPKGISYSRIRNNLEFEVDTYNVTIDNRDDAMTVWSLQADQRGSRVAVFKGFLNGTTNVNGQLLPVGDFALLLFYGRMASEDLDLEATLRVKSYIDHHRQIGPRATQEITCRFRFGDTNCGYSGPGGPCNYTLSSCRSLGNEARFGGYPSLNTDSQLL